MTIFEKILTKELTANIVYEDDYSLAFKDISPQAPIHVLVIPKKKAQNFSQLASWSANEVAGYMQGIANTIAQLGLDKGYRLVFNTGEDGGQTVDYLHAHILAGESLGWPPFPL